MEASDAFDVVTMNYEKCKRIISTITDMENVLRKEAGNPPERLEVNLSKFEILLQFVLFDLAIAQTFLFTYGKGFINCIKHNGDLFKETNKWLKKNKSTANIQLTWDNCWEKIHWANKSEQQLIFEAISNAGQAAAGTFVIGFAIVDKVTGSDYMNQVENAMKDIIRNFKWLDWEEIQWHKDDSSIPMGISFRDELAAIDLCTKIIENNYNNIKNKIIIK